MNLDDDLRAQRATGRRALQGSTAALAVAAVLGTGLAAVAVVPGTTGHTTTTTTNTTTTTSTAAGSGNALSTTVSAPVASSHGS